MTLMTQPDGARARILYLPHGGGPLPLLGDPGHAEMVDFLTAITPRFGAPEAIVVISAHWEAALPTLIAGAAPQLVYDYFGFPAESYRITYPAPGAPQLATEIHGLLQQAGIDARLDAERPYDHGLYVPLKLMYPAAQIPCLQLSLVRGLDAQTHIALGRALRPLRERNLLIIGSGFSFHNLGAFFAATAPADEQRNRAFEAWLNETCTDPGLSEAQRLERLRDWQQAPSARYCHPREEHLLPLHVCAGLGEGPADRVFAGTILGKHASAFLWSCRPGEQEN